MVKKPTETALSQKAKETLQRPQILKWPLPERRKRKSPALGRHLSWKRRKRTKRKKKKRLKKIVWKKKRKIKRKKSFLFEEFLFRKKNKKMTNHHYYYPPLKILYTPSRLLMKKKNNYTIGIIVSFKLFFLPQQQLSFFSFHLLYVENCIMFFKELGSFLKSEKRAILLKKLELPKFWIIIPKF